MKMYNNYTKWEIVQKKKKLYNYLITFVSKSTGEYKCTGVEYFNTKAGINKNV